MSVNKVILLGNLGKDPELRFTPQQMAIARFSIATNERKKDQSGNWSDHTEWHNVVVFGKSAENCSKFLKKGRQAYIEGRIRTNKWQDKEGKDRYTTEILADTVQFIGGARGETDMGGMMSSHEPANDNVMAGLSSADSLPKAAVGGGAPVFDVPAAFDDDDIPF
jgi:single-strand DNA-binding protein